MADHVVCQFAKNAREQVRVSLGDYRGTATLDLRVYYLDEDGEYRASRKGLCVSRSLLPKLLTGLVEAAREAMEDGRNGEPCKGEAS